MVIWKRRYRERQIEGSDKTMRTINTFAKWADSLPETIYIHGQPIPIEGPITDEMRAEISRTEREIYQAMGWHPS